MSDLEYLQLREQGNYEHHRETPIREVEPVSEELSGHLTRKGATGRVISQSQADVREQRLARIRAKYASVLEQTKVELPSTGKSEESKQAPFRYARSVEDFLAKANASYDKFLQEEKQRNPGFDDAEARLQSSLMQQMARNIWFEELLME